MAIGRAVDLLGLEGLHEALGEGVVPGAAGPAHGGLDACGEQAIDVVSAGVLDALIGVVDEPEAGDVPGRQGLVQRLQGELRAQVVGQGPADHLAGEDVEHHGQIDERLRQPDIGNVGRPQLVEASQDQAARQMGPANMGVATVGGRRPEGGLA
jgi:hypothetical protein